MTIFLDLLKIIISWPLSIFIISIIFIFKFSEEIKIFLKNVESFKAGPVEVQRQSEKSVDVKQKKEKTTVSKELKQKGITLTDEQLKKLEVEFNKLLQETNIKDQQIKDKEKFIDYLIFRSEWYEFSYLNLFLVFNSKSVLKWFSLYKSVTKDFFHLSFQGNIFSYFEREAILNALINNKLLEYVDSSYKVTNKGIRFLNFIGLNK